MKVCATCWAYIYTIYTSHIYTSSRGLAPAYMLVSPGLGLGSHGSGVAEEVVQVLLAEHDQRLLRPQRAQAHGRGGARGGVAVGRGGARGGGVALGGAQRQRQRHRGELCGAGGGRVARPHRPALGAERTVYTSCNPGPEHCLSGWS